MHAPGPWSAYHQGPMGAVQFAHDEGYRVADDQDHTVCWIPRDCDQDDQNMLLIIAAPALLKACKALLEYEYDSGDGNAYGRRLRQIPEAIALAARAIIAKAEVEPTP